MTFAFASLVTHSLFRTVPGNQTVNGTSSYLDLSPLYGTNQAEQDLVRNKEEGRGLLYNDAFAEDRLVLVPPAASALLVVFSRNHNVRSHFLPRIGMATEFFHSSLLRDCWKLMSVVGGRIHHQRITEPAPRKTRRSSKPLDLLSKWFLSRRVALFVCFEGFVGGANTSFSSCGHFMAMIFGDYVGGFLGLARDGSGWSMNPFDVRSLVSSLPASGAYHLHIA